MRIKDLFKRDILRAINGVVKADQLDDSTVWQELDEFVLTQECLEHLRSFFAAYLETIDNPHGDDLSENIGVWVSGSYGSGKSHFIKMLSYLLANEVHLHRGESQSAVEFFEGKVCDNMFYSDIKRAVASNTDVILFNIDSKADSKSGRDAILAVFLKTLNELQGYCSDHPHIAQMERYLEGKGKLATFRDAFKRSSGSDWQTERDAYAFNHDQVIAAWCEATGQSRKSAEKWIDGAANRFTLTVEHFCRWVKDYLDRQGPKHRLIFLVDEVGQFIGSDTHLMLNLQTITEGLGTMCGGRAWVVVTSQEDIDVVLDDLKTAKAHDFSKIQARFKTRLSLSSANVDEVIQERLLVKHEVADVRDELDQVCNLNTLGHQLCFTNVDTTFRQFRDEEDFRRNYPFAPYQFQLVQRVFEAVRKTGATGADLSRGERSVLDAFQSAAKSVAESSIGALVPFYHFYPAIESFLEPAVKKALAQAAGIANLKSFDIKLHRVLFLIRYVDEIQGSLDNLTTLCVDNVDADRSALKKRIEESLRRLENETFIAHNGDAYFFLTNEERDIRRDIKSVDFSNHERAKLVGEIVFDDLFKGCQKHCHRANNMEFAFNRVCDGVPYGSRADHDLKVQLFTSMAASHTAISENSRLQRESRNNDGQVVIKIEDAPSLAEELGQYLQTDNYLRSKANDTSSETSKRIHRALAADNQQRRDRLKNLLGTLLVDATYFAVGQRIEIKSSAPRAALEKALEYLIDNTFSKIVYMTHFSDDPSGKLLSLLSTNDFQQAATFEISDRAMNEIRDYIVLACRANQPIILHEMIERYRNRPYGWPDPETLILIAQLFLLGEIQLVLNGTALAIEQLYENLAAPRKRQAITVVRRSITDPVALQKARSLGKDVFTEMGPDSEDGLCEFLKDKCEAWISSLANYKNLADTGIYPGQREIGDGLSTLNSLLVADESAEFISTFLESTVELHDLSDAFHDIDNFYRHQKPTWESLRNGCARFDLNRLELERHEQARTALHRMAQILTATSPYSLLHEAEGLVSTVDKINNALVTERRDNALARITDLQSRVVQAVERANGDDSLRRVCLLPLEVLRHSVESQESVAHIAEAVQESELALDVALEKTDAFMDSAGRGDESNTITRTAKQSKTINPASLMESRYLETPADIDDFLAALRRELEDALGKGERVRIR